MAAPLLLALMSVLGAAGATGTVAGASDAVSDLPASPVVAVDADLPVIGSTHLGTDGVEAGGLTASLPSLDGLTGTAAAPQDAGHGSTGLAAKARQAAEAWQDMAPAEKAGVGAAVLAALAAAAMVAKAGGVAWTLFSRIEPGDLEKQPTRTRLMAHVEAFPGASPQELRRALSLAWGTVVYHLDRLERAGRIVAVRRGGRVRYWREGSADGATRRHVALLHSRTTRAVAGMVATRPGIRPRELSTILGLARPTASKHLRRLADDGLIEARASRRARHYYPTESLRALATSMTL